MIRGIAQCRGFFLRFCQRTINKLSSYRFGKTLRGLGTYIFYLCAVSFKLYYIHETIMHLIASSTLKKYKKR
jgi:hypothetical protein